MSRTRKGGALSRLLAGLVLCGASQGASAEDIDTLGGRLPVASGMKCFSQTFDENHLAAHPTQRITSIALVLSHMELRGYYQYRVWPYLVVVRLKGEKAAFWQVGECEFEKGSLECSVDCDGGHVTLAAPEAGAGLQLELAKNFRLQGGCGDRRKTVFLSRKTEEPLYALEAKDMKTCASKIRASRQALEWFNDFARKP